MLRRVFVLSALAVAGASHASFELMMVLDAGTKSIHRFDPQTGAYFGQFGQGYFSDPRGMAIDQNRGLVYVHELSRTSFFVFDYNTGAYVNEVVAGNGYSYEFAQMDVRADGFLAVSGDFAAGDTFNANLVDVSTFNGNGNQLSVTWVGNELVFSQSSGELRNTAGVITSDPFFASINGMEARGTRVASVDGAGNVLRLFASDGSGRTSYSIAASMFNPRDITWGHGQQLFAVGRNVGNTAGIVGRYSAINGANLGTFGSGILQNPTAVDMVVAPEPGTLIAVGLGLAALVRRRRR